MSGQKVARRTETAARRAYRERLWVEDEDALFAFRRAALAGDAAAIAETWDALMDVRRRLWDVRC